MFKNKIILITGGSSGIGEAAALMFSQNGGDIAITYGNNKQGADKVVEKIKEMGQRAIAIHADLIDESKAENVVDEVMKEFGKIDVLINNAGRYIDGDEWNGTFDIWLRSLEQNLLSAMNMSKYVIEVFQRQKSGIIVSVSSRHGLDGQYDAIAYSAAKAGIINMTQSYAKLLSPFGRANSVSPSAVNAGYWLTASREEIEETLANKSSHKFI